MRTEALRMGPLGLRDNQAQEEEEEDRAEAVSAWDILKPRARKICSSLVLPAWGRGTGSGLRRSIPHTRTMALP